MHHAFCTFPCLRSTTTTRKCLILRFVEDVELNHFHATTHRAAQNGLDLEQRTAFLSCLALPRQGQRHVELKPLSLFF